MKKTLFVLLLAVAVTFTACANRNYAEQAPSSSAAPAAPAESADYLADAAPPQSEAVEGVDSESYLVIDPNREEQTNKDSMLTFSLKVDTASYTNVERFIQNGDLPPADAVRTEEMLNYFDYEGDLQFGDEPFAIATEIAPSPFDNGKYMVLTRVKTRDIDKAALPNSNLTFLIDTSGSMNSYDKLPLLQEAFALLVENLSDDDTVSIVTYAGSSEVVLDSVSGRNKAQILDALYSLRASGSTAGADGIMTAYKLAEKNFVDRGNNRVILATDGDFNVGPSSTQELENLVAQKRDNGVYLSILGFGTGNIRDDIMETLSKNGSGNYSYINNSATAKKVLVDELGSNLFVVADDVKAQVEFNPVNVKSYRLIGYENRRMSNRDFADDTKDAGEIGVGTDVVALFEVELQNAAIKNGEKYNTAPATNPNDLSGELLEVRIRYKNRGESESNLITAPVTFGSISESPSADFGFACSVAAFGELLRGSEYTRDLRADDVLAVAKNNLGEDSQGYRLNYLLLLQQYKNMVD